MAAEILALVASDTGVDSLEELELDLITLAGLGSLEKLTGVVSLLAAGSLDKLNGGGSLLITLNGEGSLLNPKAGGGGLFSVMDDNLNGEDSLANGVLVFPIPAPNEKPVDDMEGAAAGTTGLVTAGDDAAGVDAGTGVTGVGRDALPTLLSPASGTAGEQSDGAPGL